MINAPFLLQAFAARLLAAKSEETVARAELLKQGYDVDTLIDMIEAYQTLPESQRGFVVHATDTEIHIRRKANGAAPVIPSVGIPAASHPTAPDAKASLPHSPNIAALVSYSAKKSGLPNGPKKPTGERS